MKEIEKGQNLEVTVNELVEKYDWLLTESSVQSIKKYGKMQTKTKKSVIAQLENQFESVKVISKKGRYGGTSFELKGFKGLVEYERENKGGRPSLDWNNELFVIRELINEEVRNEEVFYKGFTISKILAKMLGFGFSEFDKARKKDILENAVKESPILSMSEENKSDYYGLKETVNNLIRNQRHLYISLIEKEIKKTNHRISYLDSNGNEISIELYEEYMVFKKEVETKIKAENEKIKSDRNRYYKAGQSAKDLPKAKNEHKEIENAVQEKFGFKYAYRFFNVFDEVEIKEEGDINLVRDNFFNRIMKNANSSQSKYEKTEVNYSEKVYYRLCHAGLYEEVMDSVFCKMIGVESKMVDEVDEDPEELQRHIDNVEQYEAEQRLEQEEFYNQDDFIDVERILYEMENPLTDEECEESYAEFFNY